MPELFANFEVNKDPRWPILLRLTGGSIFLHLLLLWLVVYVPAFRDALNIAALLANTRFVEKPYSATRLVTVTLLDLNKEKFHYPEGYFAIENQQLGSEYAANFGSAAYAPKIISRASKESNRRPAHRRPRCRRPALLLPLHQEQPLLPLTQLPSMTRS
jgi:hypothetical protein